jgi:hypothetical protein
VALVLDTGNWAITAQTITTNAEGSTISAGQPVWVELDGCHPQETGDHICAQVVSGQTVRLGVFIGRHTVRNQRKGDPRQYKFIWEATDGIDWTPTHWLAPAYTQRVVAHAGYQAYIP